MDGTGCQIEKKVHIRRVDEKPLLLFVNVSFACFQSVFFDHMLLHQVFSVSHHVLFFFPFTYLLFYNNNNNIMEPNVTSTKKQFHVGWEGVSTSVPQPTLRRLSLYPKSFHVGWATDVETGFPLRGIVIPRRGMLHLFLFFFVFLSFSRRLLYSTEVKWLGFHCGVLSFPVVECCIYFYFFLFFLVFHDG
jgi:hypothetical protein